MSTRCVINFTNGNGTVAAKIYRHSNGYPDTEHGVLADLTRFFADVQAQTQDTRFGDAPYLAAKYVVWQARKNARHIVQGDVFKSSPSQAHRITFVSHADDRPLDFLSVGIVMEDPDDIEYVYTVKCNGVPPKVSYRTFKASA